MTNLGEDWTEGEDGLPFRKAARVVVILRDGKTLLLHGKDGHDPNHTWWFTVGGGIETGERPVQAAVRELFEETGIRAREEQLVGPVAKRNAVFEFTNVVARQLETYFLLFLDLKEEDVSLNRTGQSSSERKLVDRSAFFTVGELETLAQKATVYPLGLPELVEQWRSGWDGTCRVIQG